jgi:hypothetical protein
MNHEISKLQQYWRFRNSRFNVGTFKYANFNQFKSEFLVNNLLFNFSKLKKFFFHYKILSNNGIGNCTAI